MQVGGVGPNTEDDEKSAYNNVQVGVGPQQREIGFPISPDNASWVGRRNKFYENIISVPLPSKE
ncbi:nitrogen regulation protein NIFR3 [Staphylococcus aureus]|nr:nitrogen regulation protein NIFR3 [Staphylococcus aureus]